MPTDIRQRVNATVIVAYDDDAFVQALEKQVVARLRHFACVADKLPFGHEDLLDVAFEDRIGGVEVLRQRVARTMRGDQGRDRIGCAGGPRICDVAHLAFSYRNRMIESGAKPTRVRAPARRIGRPAVLRIEIVTGRSRPSSTTE